MRKFMPSTTVNLGAVNLCLVSSMGLEENTQCMCANGHTHSPPTHQQLNKILWVWVRVCEYVGEHMEGVRGKWLGGHDVNSVWKWCKFMMQIHVWNFWQKCLERRHEVDRG